ncbi:hypothetical protein WCD74_01870 [Actinomycetospora sp. OC33-EN08]|uniref:Uncharacterized protein n=1 Tax=Actinomycetospora aurantiaca TaxID=3129233 RepID=A0ABU8MGS1_9PSEU
MGKHSNAAGGIGLDVRGGAGRTVMVAGTVGVGLLAAAAPAMAGTGGSCSHEQDGHSVEKSSHQSDGGHHGSHGSHGSKSGSKHGGSSVTDITSSVTTLTGGNGGAGTGGAGGNGGLATGGQGGINVLSGSNLALLGKSAPSENSSSGGDAQANGGTGGTGTGGHGSLSNE